MAEAVCSRLRGFTVEQWPISWPTVQELHTDAPHGPWAFVLSLTPRERAFAGGQTLVMQPRVLNYWPDFDPSAGLEMKHLVPARPALLFCCWHLTTGYMHVRGPMSQLQQQACMRWLRHKLSQPY